MATISASYLATSISMLAMLRLVRRSSITRSRNSAYSAPTFTSPPRSV
ncbi:hypothetical protein PXO_01192 [Xanthomonas oryzae pv. oryzae PXO99A]|uniref:Uncharacterized protein n=1 Tax=Xanthomonas oryzae pv. oryzae (strain PXO99A) TaxID=360094 RepID=A0A0K0GLI6_XANOP|nr:hypothetical protein PXO_01192 [Xanthomonas oryzae pv. oryzae PXO99A]